MTKMSKGEEQSVLLLSVGKKQQGKENNIKK